jgi:hypothetical protein
MRLSLFLFKVQLASRTNFPLLVNLRVALVFGSARSNLPINYITRLSQGHSNCSSGQIRVGRSDELIQSAHMQLPILTSVSRQDFAL